MPLRSFSGSALAATLALTLTACVNNVPARPDPAGLTGQVSGTIEDWGNRGAATIEAQYQPPSTDASKFVTLSKGTVNADGSFSLELPSASAVAPYLVAFQQSPREGCTGAFTQSAPTAKHFGVNDYALRRADGSYIGFLVQDNPGQGATLKAGDYFIERLYADQAHTVTGTLACPSYKITLNLDLKQGWNAVVNTVNGVDAEGRITANTISTVSKLPPSKF